MEPGDRPGHQEDIETWNTSAQVLRPWASSAPGIGIGILAGLAAGAIGRNPDAAEPDPRPRHHPRGVRRRPWRAGDRRRPARRSSSSRPGAPWSSWPSPAIAGHRRELAARRRRRLTINFFWVLVAASTFIVFAVLAWSSGSRPWPATLEARRARIEQGLKDADAARRDREAAADRAPGRPGRGAPRGARDPGARPEARGREPRARTSRRRGRDSSDCASRPSRRSTPSGSGPSTRSARRSPTWRCWPPARSSARP